MSLDLLIPFAILFVLIIYLIYSRNKFEKNIVNIYESKFEEWKKYNINSKEEPNHKELIGLVFKNEHKILIELFYNNIDKRVEDRLKDAKFDLEIIGKSSE